MGVEERLELTVKTMMLQVEPCEKDIKKKDWMEEIRLDGCDHLPNFTSTSTQYGRRCILCRNGRTHVYCIKCRVYLCFTKEKPHFQWWHYLSRKSIVEKVQKELASQAEKKALKANKH